jgi:adenylylsulfate reductase subunit B
MPPVIDKNVCTGCGTCVEVCQMDVFFGSKKGDVPSVTYPEECWHCSACVLDCPVAGAIKIRMPLPLSILYK